METVVVHRLVKARWGALMLACRTSYEVAKRVGEDERLESVHRTQ